MLGKQPPPVNQINAARGEKSRALPGSEVYNMCEQRLAELEEREPRYVLHR